MVDVNELKAQIIRQGKTQKEVYEGIGLTKRQWDDRISKAKFDTDEMYDIVSFLDMKDPMPVFFAHLVTNK